MYSTLMKHGIDDKISVLTFSHDMVGGQQIKVAHRDITQLNFDNNIS